MHVEGFILAICCSLWKSKSSFVLTECSSLNILKQLSICDETRKGFPFIGAYCIWSIVHRNITPPNGIFLFLAYLNTISNTESNFADICPASSRNLIFTTWSAFNFVGSCGNLMNDNFVILCGDILLFTSIGNNLCICSPPKWTDHLDIIEVDITLNSFEMPYK